MLFRSGMKDVGRYRSINQDYIYISEKPVGNLPNLFLVADGMGGHKAGDLASEYTVSRIREAVEKSMRNIPLQILKSAFQYANQRLIEKARESSAYTGMGTTLVAATVVGNTAYIANVGDSRLYKIGQSIEQITTDHSLVEEMVRIGEISKEEAKKRAVRGLRPEWPRPKRKNTSWWMATMLFLPGRIFGSWQRGILTAQETG